MPLGRSGTRRVVKRNNTFAPPPPPSAGPVPPRKGLADIQQGIKVLHNPGDNVKPEVDIVFVPGLGADPEKSWQSSKNEFNWIKDPKDGLARDFPKARISLYQYESAWRGGLKVKQFMFNIAFTLLNAVVSSREDDSQTPVVFIGHSMGGLVVAKAITIADARRDQFSALFECITGCVFFGTPFDGAEAAAAASMLDTISAKIDKTESSSLLEMMKPGDVGLKELRNEFLRLSDKLAPRTELFCFYEEQPTNFAEQAGLPAIFGIAVPKKIAEFVTKDSASLPGKDAMGLASNHRNLVKFDNPKDPRFQLVRYRVKRIIHGSPLTASSRFKATRNVDRETLRDVRKTLEGADVHSVRRTLKRKQQASSWLTAEPEYQSWVSDAPPDRKRTDTIWIRGQVGRGKTSNVLQVLEDLEKRPSNPSGVRQTSQIVYFFCDRTSDQSTAEDILKSFLHQLVEQQEMLVPYVKNFVKKKAKDDTKELSRSTLQLTIENMWQSIQDMMYDEFIGSTIFFVINNLHLLPEDSPSTQKLLEYMRADVAVTATPDPRRTQVRWLFSSRKVDNLMAAFGDQHVRLIDLEDEKYEDQVQRELKKHAYEKVLVLKEEKHYDRDVAYFAHSLIGKRAQNTQWIDIACLRLKALSQSDNRLKVRQILDTMPQDLDLLLEQAWQQVFRQNPDDTEHIKEVLRAMVLTFEDPHVPELEILAGMSEMDDEKADLRKLVEKCKPLLTTRRGGEGEIRIGFMNIVVKTHLGDNSGKLLGLSDDETQWQHGMLAFRALEHVTQKLAAVYVSEEAPNRDDDDDDDHDENHNDGYASSVAETTSDAHSVARNVPPKEDSVTDDYDDWDNDVDHDGDDQGSYWDDDNYDQESDMDDDDREAAAVRGKALSYMIKYWLRHAGQASKDMAEDLATSDDKNFWEKDSQLRRRWLFEFRRLDGRLSDMASQSLSGLHVAASVGFPQLVSALIRNGHETEIHEVDDQGNTPLHLAAYYNQAEIIDVLLAAGAELDHGQKEEKKTPLHMAASKGFVQVMKKLIKRGADINAFSDEDGPVINGAIDSGNREAVETLISSGAKLSLEDHDDWYPPLAVAAMNSDTTLFDYLISACADKLPSREYDEALVASADAGQAEIFKRLLTYSHSKQIYQDALDRATEEAQWEIVKIILEHYKDLDCHRTFIEASIAWDDQSEILRLILQYTNHSLSMTTINNALYEATDYEVEHIVRLLLDEFGADPNAETPTDKDEEEESYGNALTAAAYDGTINIVRLLLDKGAKIDGTLGWPLQAAAAQGHRDVVQELLSRGADVNSVVTNDNFGAGTALQAACENSQSRIVKELLEHGADPNLGGGALSYPLIAAASGGERSMLKLLLDRGVQVNVHAASDHSTPLIHAARWLPTKSVKRLLDAGAEINASDDDGDTALIAAAERGDSRCVKFLLSKGADLMHTNKRDLNALQIAVQEENDECTLVLVDAASKILRSIQIAADAGNVAVANVLHTARAMSNRDAEPDDSDFSDESDEEDDLSVDDDAAEHPELDNHDEHHDADHFEALAQPPSPAFSFGHPSPLVGATAGPSIEIQSQPGFSTAGDGIPQGYEQNRWRNNDTTLPIENHVRLNHDAYGYNNVPNTPPRPVEQPQPSQGFYNANPPIQPAIRRKLMQPAFSPPPQSTSVDQRTTTSPPPNITNDYSTSYSGSSGNLNAGPTGYEDATSQSRNSAYQSYGWSSGPPTSQDYTQPEAYKPPSQAYQGYDLPSYGQQPQQQQQSQQQQSYQNYTIQSNPSANQSLPPTNQPQNLDNSGTGYNSGPQATGYAYEYNTTGPNPPTLPPRLEERPSSSNMFGMKDGMKDLFGKAKQYGINRQK